MRLIKRFVDWNTARRRMKHRKWLKKAKWVNMPPPDRACKRNSVESL